MMFPRTPLDDAAAQGLTSAQGLYRRLYRKSRFRRCWIALTLLAAVYGGGFGIFLMVLPEPEVAMPPVDGLAVFTGGTNRVPLGLRIISDGFDGPVLISGVHPDVKVAELVALQRAAGQSAGDPLSRRQQRQITLDARADSTTANVANTLAWAAENGVRRIGVVTSTYHTLRCRLLFWWHGQLDRVWMMPVQPAMAGPVALLNEYNKLLGAPLAYAWYAYRDRELAR